MQSINYDKSLGTFWAGDVFDTSLGLTSSQPSATPYLSSPGEFYVISVINLQGVEKYNKFTYDVIGTSPTRTVKVEFRTSIDGGVNWSPWVSNITDFPEFDPHSNLFFEVKWTREGSSTIGVIRLLEYKLEGELERDEFQGGSESGFSVKLTPTDNKVIISAPYIYKVFRIDDVEVLSYGQDKDNLQIRYRFSQDNSLSWSNWEPLSKENISTKRINPIRFFQIEYEVVYTGSSSAYIQDVNLIGDFQNVSKDYFKTNLMGIRECCNSNIVDTTSEGSLTVGDGYSFPQELLNPMTDDQKNKLLNPYNIPNALTLYNTLASQAVQVIGHDVIYFSVNPDKKGQDHTFHEYQLYNIDCQGEIKVAVDSNNFPDNQIRMNQFDLSLFDTFEVHVMKQDFKQVFGVDRRPRKEDILYFCQLNRLFQVSHSQQFRNFNNSSVYYKVMLTKYNASASRIATDEIKGTIEELTKNSTLDSLMGIEKERDKADVANKLQQVTLSKDPIRLDYLVGINKELIEYSTNIISKSNYDLSSVNYREDAVKYVNMGTSLKVSDNLSFMIWFNINNYTVNDEYNFIYNYDEDNKLGYKIDLSGDLIKFVVNEQSYEFSLNGGTGSTSEAISEEIWYCYMANLDQRQRKVSQWVYKRDIDREDEAKYARTTVLNELYKYEQLDTTPQEFSLDVDSTIKTRLKLLGSDMKVTNMRIFNDVMNESEHSKIANQLIIRDSSNLILADNANTKIILSNYGLSGGGFS